MTLWRGTSLGLFTDYLKCAESVSLKKIQWATGSHLQSCISNSALLLCGGRACHCCTPQGTFSAPSLRLFGVKLCLPSRSTAMVFCILSTLQGMLIQTSHFQLNTTRESHRWVAGHSTSSLMKKWQNVIWVLFPVSQPWFYSSGLPCCMLLIYPDLIFPGHVQNDLRHKPCLFLVSAITTQRPRMSCTVPCTELRL